MMRSINWPMWLVLGIVVVVLATLVAFRPMPASSQPLTSPTTPAYGYTDTQGGY
jgi:hypothetical protein